MIPGAGAKIQVDSTHQRQAERHDLEIAVDLESDSNFYTGLTQNISSGGLFIATHQIKRVGDHVRLKFSLPGSPRPLEVDTEVRWIRENSSLHRTDGASGMGVRFINMSPEDAQLISIFLENRDSLFYDDE
ncbi:MAG: TIGR02266 family protein [Pseudomonadota bacterium]